MPLAAIHLHDSAEEGGEIVSPVGNARMIPPMEIRESERGSHNCQAVDPALVKRAHAKAVFAEVELLEVHLKARFVFKRPLRLFSCFERTPRVVRRQQNPILCETLAARRLRPPLASLGVPRIGWYLQQKCIRTSVSHRPTELGTRASNCEAPIQGRCTSRCRSSVSLQFLSFPQESPPTQRWRKV